MTLNHNKQQLDKKKPEMQNTISEYTRDKSKVENLEKDLKNFENELQKLNYQEGFIESLQEQKQNIEREIRKLTDKVDNFESYYPQLRFSYRDPEPNFRKSSVKGLVCKSINVIDKSAAYAIEVAAGGKVCKKYYLYEP